MSDKTPSPQSVVVPVEREYRKTATIRASQWFRPGDHPAVVMKSAPNRYADDGVPWIETLEGGHVVTPGDWIATGVQGEHWPIKPDIFASTYALAAALSPEAPAREVSEWFGVTGASDETEALAVALFDARCPGIRMTNKDLHYYRAAAQRAMKAVADELDTPALTPRHEAPAEGAGGLGSPSQWCDFLPEPSGPAEGAGEREEIARIVEPSAFVEETTDHSRVYRNLSLQEGRAEAFTKAEKIIALRARSSAPEAREVRRTMTLNLSDAEMTAIEELIAKKDLDGPKIFRNSFKLYQAVEHGAASVTWTESGPLGLPYTHPAVPSADKLRIAVEALEAERAWHESLADFACDDAMEASERKEKANEATAMRRMNAHNARVSVIDRALAALKGDANP